MQEANVSIDRIENAPIVSSERAHVHLRHLSGPLFAVTPSPLKEPSYVFLSPKLERYLDEEHPRIVSVALIQQHEVAGPKPNYQLRLELGLADGRRLTVDENDSVFEASRFGTNSEQPGAQPALQVWDLPAKLPYARMLLTNRLIQALNHLAEGGQHAHLLTVLWKEYELARQDAKTNKQTLHINGEFMSFSARAFHQHLVVFDDR